MLSNFEYDSATGLLLKQNYGNGDCINYSYDNLDRLSYKMYNGDGNRKLSYSYGRDGNIASSFDSATGEKTVFCYDLANRAVGQKTYVGSTLSSLFTYTYADKTNYLVGVKHKFALGEQTIGYRYGNLSIGEMPDQIYGVTWNGKEKIGYSYDGFGRITDKTVMPSLSKTLHNRYTYYNRESGNRTSTTVKSLETANGTYTYTYDAAGNILSINDGTYTVSYVYDGLNQLVRENDQRADTTTVYTYTNGNITGKKVYKYTLGNVGEEIKSTSYGYSNSEWRDLLTSFNGQAVTYDEIGNPLTFGSKTFEWCGRQLERITDGDNTYVYAYNTDGDRVSKTVNGVKTEYFYNGSILAGQKMGDETLIFMYDNNGDAFGFIYNGEEYYYIKNVQNDIVAIADKNGDIVANYYYDAWGNVTQITGNTALAQTNPLRYRSYYYDSETGYYHLKSRYYSPEVGRFLNADSVTDGGGGNLGGNLFLYAANNPINNSDPSGHWIIKNAIKWVAKNIVRPIVKKIEKNSRKANGTYSYGVNISGSPSAFSFNMQGGISFDRKGNVALQTNISGGVTGGSPGISATSYKTVTNAPNIRKLNGIGGQVGGSVAALVYGAPVFIGGDINIIPDSDSTTIYHGITSNVGIGTPGGELHVEWGETYTWEQTEFNVFDVAKAIYVKIMEW